MLPAFLRFFAAGLFILYFCRSVIDFIGFIDIIDVIS